MKIRGCCTHCRESKNFRGVHGPFPVWERRGRVIDLPQVLSGKLEDTWNGNKNSVNLAITSPSLVSIYSSTCERYDKRGRKVKASVREFSYLSV